MSNTSPKLLRILAVLLEGDTKMRTSGNIKSQLTDLEEDKRLELADVVFQKNDNRTAIFSKALALGRRAKEKMVTWVEIKGTYYYFIGTEADVLKKLTPVADDEAKKADEAKKTETQSTETDLAKQEKSIMDQVDRQANEVLNR